MKKITLFLLTLFCSISSLVKADHVVGYDMALISLGNDMYKFRLVAFRDVLGIPIAGSFNFNIYKNIDNAQVMAFACPQVSFVPIVYDPKDCPPTGADLRLEKYTYESAPLNLSTLNSAQGYYATASTCCRNVGVTNVPNSSATGITFTIDFPRLNTTSPYRFNSSPEFKKAPLAFFCVGKPYSLNWNVTDPNGDSLVYSVAQSNDQGTTKPLPLIPYNPGYNLYYNVLDGVPDLTINSKTGFINFIPTKVGRYLVAFRVEEYRAGVKIGEIRREFQLETVICNDAPPVTTDDQNQKRVIVDTIYYNTQYDKLFTSRDSPTDSLFMYILPNITPGENVLDPAKFGAKWGEVGSLVGGSSASNLIIDGPQQVTGQFSWKPSCAVVRPNKPYNFTIVVRDKTCPSPFYDSTFVSLFVKKKPNYKPYFILPDTIKTTKTNNYFVLAGDKFQLNTDSIIKTYDQDSSQVVSVLFEPDPANGLVNSEFIFSSNPALVHSTASFSWQTECADARPTPYKVRFLAVDNDCLRPDSADFFINIYVIQRPNLRPQFDKILNPETFHIAEGTTDTFNVRVNDSASFTVNQYNSLTITADLSDFTSVVGGAMPTFNPVVTTDSTVTKFIWSPNCANVRVEPYNLYLTVVDNGCPYLTSRDTIQVFADGPFNSAPEFRFPDHPNSIVTTIDTSIFGGDIFNYSLYAVDTNIRFDSVFIYPDISSDLFTVGTVSNLPYLIPRSGKDSSRTAFRWESTCADISTTSYSARIVARDNECVNPEKTTLTFNITVKERPNFTPQFTSSTSTSLYTVQARDTLIIPLAAIDTNHADILVIDTVYTTIPSYLPLPEIVRVTGNDSVKTVLRWIIDCSLIRTAPYTIKVGAWDNACRLVTDSARYQFNIQVNRNPNLLPVFPFGVNDTVIELVAGQKYELNLTSTSSVPGDSIAIFTSGDVFGGIAGNLASFEQTNVTGTAQAKFVWETGCDQIRDDVYTANFKTANPPCLTDTSIYTIYFKVIPNTDVTEELPNVFTPGTDGKNDIYAIKDKYKVYCDPKFQFTIYNRWGKKVFQTKDPDFGWDGEGAGAGTYFYTLESRVRTQTGTINLVR